MKMADLEFKSQEQRQKIAIDANRAQDKIIRDAIRSQRDSLFDQDFLGLFKSKEALADKFEDVAIGASQALADSFLSQSNQVMQARQQVNAGTNTTNNISNVQLAQSINGAENPQLVAQMVQQEIAAIIG